MAVSLTDRKRSLIFINILITCIASSFLSTALSVATPPITQALDVDLATGQWLTSGYALAMGIMMPLTAFLITRFRTKPLYLIAIGSFLVGLAVCAFAPNFQVMMAGRVLQACSNGLTTSMAQVILLTIYPPERQGQVMGWYGLSVSVAPVIAPTLAGALLDLLGWQSIFIVPFFIMLASFLYAIAVFDDVLESSPRKFDFLSFLLSGLAFGGITLGVGNLSTYGLRAAVSLAPLILGIVAAVFFIRRQLSVTQPFLELRVFKRRPFTVSVIGSMLLYLSMMGASLLLPIYVQSVLGLPATISGLVTLPGSLAMAVVSPLAGGIYDRIGMRRLALVGAVCMIISTGGMAFVTMETSILVAVALNAVRCVAIGCLLMTFVTWGVGSVSEQEKAAANALISSLRTVAGAIGTAVFVGLMNTVALHSADTYGANAGIHGLNVSFIAMCGVSVVLLVVSFLFIRSGEGQFSKGE